MFTEITNKLKAFAEAHKEALIKTGIVILGVGVGVAAATVVAQLNAAGENETLLTDDNAALEDEAQAELDSENE